MSEFSDRPFVAGSLTGLRAFKLDGLGRLRGPQYDQVFTPEENVAVCRKGEGDTWSLLRSAITYNVFMGDPPSLIPTQLPSAASAVKAPEPQTHDVGSLNCQCGFYGYFDGSNDYKDRTRVAAIIEGYGVCSVGTRGFRAEKARLVALIEPKAHVPDRLRRYLGRNYPDVPIYPNRRTAVAEHPMSAGYVPTPQDADFWTRDDR